MFLKGRAELIISPITWSGLVEIYSYHLPRTLKILRVMKGPPPAASEPGPPARRGGQGGLPNMAGGGRRRLPARGRVTVLYSSGRRRVPARDSTHSRVDVSAGTGGAISRETGKGQS